MPRSPGLVSDSSRWLGIKPAPAAFRPLPQFSGEGVKGTISALLAVMYGFGSDFGVVALMWDGERKLQALLSCLFPSRGLLRVAGCLEELCPQPGGRKGISSPPGITCAVRVQPAQALVAVALSGVMGCARAPGGPRLFLQPLLQLAVGRAGAVLQEQRLEDLVGAGFVTSAANKIKQSVRIPLEIWGLLSGP